MNIFILSVARSGSFTLTNAFAKTFDLNPIREPYNVFLDNSNLSEDIQKDRMNLRNKMELPNRWVVKCISDEVSFHHIEFLHSKSNNTILLGRRETHRKIESLNYAFRNLNADWHQKYTFKRQTISEEVRRISYRQDELLNTYSSLLDIPITYYEDLYFNDKFRYEFVRNFTNKGITLLSYLDKNYKYRKDSSII